MLTLPNGDKWISDTSEYEGIVSYQEALLGNIPETSLDEFIKVFVKNGGGDWPLKLIKEHGVSWFKRYDISEVFNQLKVRKIQTDFFEVYEMPNGKIYVYYRRPDSGGYDMERALKEYPNMEEYLKAVTFKD